MNEKVELQQWKVSVEIFLGLLKRYIGRKVDGLVGRFSRYVYIHRYTYSEGLRLNVFSLANSLKEKKCSEKSRSLILVILKKKEK